MAKRKTNVKKHIRVSKKGKPGVVRKHRRKVKKPVTIKSRERKIFTHLSNPKEFPIEYGGALDFDKKGTLEKMEVRRGDTYSVFLPDYEALYHTHPTSVESPPSPEDLYNLIVGKRQQAEMIFRDGLVFTIIKTPQSKKHFEKKSDREILSELDHIFTRTQGVFGIGWEERYAKELKKIGFKVQITPKGGSDINIDIKPVE